jgi:hypothetical protein
MISIHATSLELERNAVDMAVSILQISGGVEQVRAKTIEPLDGSISTRSSSVSETSTVDDTRRAG